MSLLAFLQFCGITLYSSLDNWGEGFLRSVFLFFFVFFFFVFTHMFASSAGQESKSKNPDSISIEGDVYYNFTSKW